ncbi:MAG: glycosyltransferase family 2 protein [Flavobacteriales bacterium]|nr:glycosyltransferase family 2 protein [Flavobacteriales bacterium]
MIKKLSIIIPVFNEKETIYKLLGIVQRVILISNIEKELIVVDDCSTDGSLDEIKRYIAETPDHLITLVQHRTNIGKGGSIRTGIQKASGDYTIIQDADLELSPSEYNQLLEPILNNTADIVYGSRFIGSTKHKKESAAHRLANHFLTWLGNVVNGVKLTDMQTCYKLVPTEIFKELKLKEKRFAFDSEITARLAKYKKLRWTEVAITYEPRTQKEGKKIGYIDGFRAIYSIIRYGWFAKK